MATATEETVYDICTISLAWDIGQMLQSRITRPAFQRTEREGRHRVMVDDMLACVPQAWREVQDAYGLDFFAAEGAMGLDLPH